MSYVIIWSPDAITTFEDRIAYLRIHFAEKEITNFTERVREYLSILEREALIGKPGKFRNIHVGLIVKQVSIIYRVKTRKKEIEIVLFVDNRMDPKKIRKYKS